MRFHEGIDVKQISWSIFVVHFFLEGVKQVSPHYPTVELRAVRGLGFGLEATLYRILDPVLTRINRIILESFLIRAGIQDPRLPRSLSGILDLGSQPESKMIPK